MDPQPPPPRPDSPPRRLRACAPCTRAKARCNFREENARRHLCDRCERLKIDCSAKTRGIRRTRQIKPLVDGPSVEPGSGSPQRLAREKPFLFRAIMLAAAPAGKARAEAMHRELLAEMGARMMLEEEGGLDLLQGMAECRYWFDKQITRLVYTALGYAHSLGITKPPRSLLQPSPCRPGGSQQHPYQYPYQHPYQQQWQQQQQQQQRQEPEDCFTNKATLSATEHHTLEEQRTFLGLFCVVTSNCAQFARKQNPLLHCLGSDGGGHICYENLAASGSLEDRMAARMFKMAAISARLTDGFGPVMDCERGMAYLNLQHKALLVQLYEPATKSPFSSSSPSSLYSPAAFQNTTTNSTTTTTTLNRTTYFQAALSEAKAYFDATLALPPEAYVYRTSVSMGLAQGVLAVTTRLLILHGVPGWDLSRARTDVKFAEICENLVAFLGRVLQVGRERMGRLKEETWVRGVGGGATGGGSDCGRAYNTLEFDWDDINGGSEIDARGSMCEDLIGKMRWIKDWYESRVRAEDGGVTTTTTPAAAAGGGVGSAEAANKELMEEITRIWHWPADAASMPMFGGLINPFDICYDSI
ncbi:uncharacterized protein N0V96_004804 [Colletotrichum fioriniae]|uniref:uncharacterized protein n=1 Tax=Colletotrichum fioriniae TaxID=710243 RepID=UPI0032DBC8FA|nr:hypothetical protein N0V96_004804 [Colletotrichum fioriniae]